MRRALLFTLLLSACAVGGGPAGSDGGGGDLAPAAGDLGGGGDVDGGPDGTGPARYPAGALHSPWTRGVVDRLAPVVAASNHRPDVFAKVGDSITVNTYFLACYAGTDVMLDSESALEPSRTYWGRTSADGMKSSYDRTSLAAGVGWSASAALAGSPSPLDQEVAAIDPGFAVVMFGTNDTSTTGFWAFEKNLRLIVDDLLAQSIVPVLSTIPPRGDSAAINQLVPEMNAVIRAVAEARQVPYVDYWQTMVNLPSYGLASDGVHPQVYTGGHACWLTPPALQFGFNQRNRVTLESLDRLRRYLFLAEAPEAPPAPPLAGAGSFGDPRIVDALPFVDHGDTSLSPSSIANVYSCATQNEGGPEIVYRVDVPAAMHLRARVYADDGVDVDLQWLSQPDAQHCLTRGDKTAELDAQPGTLWLAVDSFVSGGRALAGGYRLTIVPIQ